MFRYEINDGEALINDFTDKLVTHIDVPEFIDGYPVTGVQFILFNLVSINIPKSVKYIYGSCFIYASNLTHINNNKLNDGFNLINDSFIFLGHKNFKIVYKIKFKICDDYVCMSYNTFNHLINGCIYSGKFN